jgi:hypothetical protein
MTTPPYANAQDVSFLKAKLYTPYLGLPKQNSSSKKEAIELW